MLVLVLNSVKTMHAEKGTDIYSALSAETTTLWVSEGLFAIMKLVRDPGCL